MTAVEILYLCSFTLEDADSIEKLLHITSIILHYMGSHAVQYRALGLHKAPDFEYILLLVNSSVIRHSMEHATVFLLHSYRTGQRRPVHGYVGNQTVKTIS